MLIALRGLKLPLGEKLETFFREDPDPIRMISSRLLAHAVWAVLDLDSPLLIGRFVLQLDFS